MNCILSLLSKSQTPVSTPEKMCHQKSDSVMSKQVRIRLQDQVHCLTKELMSQQIQVQLMLVHVYSHTASTVLNTSLKCQVQVHVVSSEQG